MMMLKKRFGIVVLAMLLGACSPDPVPLSDDWHTSIPQGVEAGAPGQPVFVFFSATWCRICDRMKRDVLQEDGVVRALRPFSLVTVDIDRQPKTANSFQILAVPAFVVLDGAGKVRARSIGYTEAPELARMLDSAATLLADSGDSSSEAEDLGPLP